MKYISTFLAGVLVTVFFVVMFDRARGGMWPRSEIEKQEGNITIVIGYDSRLESHMHRKSATMLSCDPKERLERGYRWDDIVVWTERDIDGALAAKRRVLDALYRR